MLKPYYRIFMRDIAAKRVLNDFPIDVPKPVLGVMPYEHLNSQPIMFPLKFSYPEKDIKETEKYENQLRPSVYGPSTITSY